MKTFLVLFVIVISGQFCHGQGVKFEYDDGGNRIKRAGAPDLTPAQFFSDLQLSIGESIQYVVAISNVGQVSTVGMIEARVTRYGVPTGLDMTLNPAVNVTIDGDVFPLSNDDFDVVVSSSRFTITSKLSPAVSIPASGVKFIGFIITRTGGSAGHVNNTVSITNGTGGGEVPYDNNSISNIIGKL